MKTVNMDQAPLTACFEKRKNSVRSYDYWIKHADGKLSMGGVTFPSEDNMKLALAKATQFLKSQGFKVKTRGFGKI